ncbi:hormogonium tapered terminus morphoprotein TftA [Vacuolonema iberomarrocanum]|uniref:hormogonium tapered terminus morphoprotein TftA n=1 Tax=Vacuolonema iberomarrocanum TaxID=3454632 RepID=UPI001A0B634C|nr:N-acetylmuramoyl-L-alanine amidase [filamentous cyanobacterium LEGE 07170]
MVGRIFVSAGHGGQEGAGIDPGIIAGGTTEAREMILTRDLIVSDLRSRGFEVLSVPDDLSLQQSVAWINARAVLTDVALEIHADGSSNPTVRGTTVYYIADNDVRRSHAELMLLALMRRVPQLPSRGTKPDTAAGTGNLAFLRHVRSPSLQMNLGFLTNPQDRQILQDQRREVALGLADGLASWSRAVSGGTDPDPVYPTVSININGGIYGEQGVIINDNAYIPIDLVDRLGIDLSQNNDIVRVTYRNVVYVKAVDLRNFGISVGWDANTRTVLLRNSTVCPGQIDRIMGLGATSEVQLIVFIKRNNEDALENFPDLPKLYREEAAVEGVDHDVAFSQMCLETDYLRFGVDLRPEQNNFGGLGVPGGTGDDASFPSARIGVRAHIQHLKAYGSIAPLVYPVVDPRFEFVVRGIAPLVGQLSGRWTSDAEYGDKIMAILRQLYSVSDIL